MGRFNYCNYIAFKHRLSRMFKQYFFILESMDVYLFFFVPLCGTVTVFRVLHKLSNSQVNITIKKKTTCHTKTVGYENYLPCCVKLNCTMTRDHYLRNKSWKPECVTVGSFNMDWRILVFYPEPEARDKIY